MVSPLEALLRDTIGGTYLVQRELGGGGMSRVFLTEERALGRQVVIKVLAPELAEGLSAERFAREITLAAGLQQPNIVPVLTAGKVAGLPYYTMPFIEGRSLRRRQGARKLRHVHPVMEACGRVPAAACGEGRAGVDRAPDGPQIAVAPT